MKKQFYEPMSKESLQAIKPGDIIERMLAFAIPVPLEVGEVTDNVIKAGYWEFDRNTGLEIDDDIPMKVSYIRRVLTNDEAEQLLKKPK